MRCYVEVAIEYEAGSDRQAFVAANQIASTTEAIFGSRTFITDIRVRRKYKPERSLLKDEPFDE